MSFDNIYVKFGKNLREARKTAKMTQEDLAKILGVSNTAIVNYENGNRKMPLELVVKAAQFFDVSMDAMVGLRPYNIRFAQHWREQLGNTVFTVDEGQKIIEYAKYIMFLREVEK